MTILQPITDFIFARDEPAPSDAVMVAGGSHPELPEKAAELWKTGFAPHIFIGGGVSVKLGVFPGPKSKREVYSGAYATECDFYRDVLVKNGVDAGAILGEDQSGYTRQNAIFARRIADERGLNNGRALRVCKTFHARRCRMYYQLAFPEAEFLTVPVDCFGISRDNWFLTEYGVARVLGEVKRCGDQFGAEEIALFQSNAR